MEFLTWLAVGVTVGLAAAWLRKAKGPLTLHALVAAVGGIVFGAVFLPLIGVWMKKSGMTNIFAGGPSLVSIAEALIGALIVYFLVAKLSERAEARAVGRDGTPEAVAA